MSKYLHTFIASSNEYRSNLIQIICDELVGKKLSGTHLTDDGSFELIVNSVDINNIEKLEIDLNSPTEQYSWTITGRAHYSAEASYIIDGDEKKVLCTDQMTAFRFSCTLDTEVGTLVELPEMIEIADHKCNIELSKLVELIVWEDPPYGNCIDI